MALNVPSLQSAFRSALNGMQGGVVDPEAQSRIDTAADQMAAAVDAFIRSGTVNTTVTGQSPPGTAVAVAFPAGTGATVAPATVTGNGIGTIS